MIVLQYDNNKYWLGYSIRINNQWRICFVWVEGNAFEVEIIDYH
jgi:plasmid maintenance system killer protein